MLRSKEIDESNETKQELEQNHQGETRKQTQPIKPPVVLFVHLQFCHPCIRVYCICIVYVLYSI